MRPVFSPHLSRFEIYSQLKTLPTDSNSLTGRYYLYKPFNSIGMVIDHHSDMKNVPIQPILLCKRLQPVSGRILVVDDEPAILFAYKKLIQAEGFEVDVCEGLEEALNLIETRSYNAVITDIRLSGTENTDGILLFQAIRKQQPDAILVIVTGFGNCDNERTLKELGASLYFEKPVRPSLIMEILKEAHFANEEPAEDSDF